MAQSDCPAMSIGLQCDRNPHHSLKSSSTFLEVRTPGSGPIYPSATSCHGREATGEATSKRLLGRLLGLRWCASGFDPEFSERLPKRQNDFRTTSVCPPPSTATAQVGALTARSRSEVAPR